MTTARPGWRRVTTIENGHEVTLNVRDDGPAEPTQEELAAELHGTIALGWKKEQLALGTRGRGVLEFEVFVDINNPQKLWRRYRNGRIERMFSTSPDQSPEALGTIPSRPTEPSMFPPAAQPTTGDRAEVNPFDDLDPATAAAFRVALGLRG